MRSYRDKNSRFGYNKKGCVLTAFFVYDILFIARFVFIVVVFEFKVIEGVNV